MPSITITHILLVFHIIAAGVLITQFPVGIVLGRLVKSRAGTPDELTYTLVQGRLMAAMGAIGGMGILITGLLLTFIDGFGVLNIGGTTPGWLVMKQIAYIVSLILVYGLVQPMAKKIYPEFAKAAAGAGTVTPEVRAQLSRLTMISMVVNLLVFVNIVLAVWGVGPTM